jgi:integrase
MATIRRRRLRSGKSAWQIDYRDASGKRRRQEFSDKLSAEQRFARVVQEERQAKPAASTLVNATVEEFSKLWLAAIKSTVAATTYNSYAQILKLYILPVISSERMLAIHEGTVGALLTSWTTKGKSANTVRLIRACLSAMFADAADTSSPLHVLTRNPVALAGGRRHRRAERKRQKVQKRKRVRVLTPEECDAFLEATAKDGLTYRSLFTYMVDSGPRPGEALALRWKHINWKQSTAWVWATKTSTERTVDLSERTVELLKKLRAEQQKRALKSGTALPDLCFLNRRGQAVDQSRLSKRLKLALMRAGLPTAHSLYDLRHTNATIALSKGEPPTYVAEQIGDSVETLHRWYAHWFPRRGRNETDAELRGRVHKADRRPDTAQTGTWYVVGFSPPIRI